MSIDMRFQKLFFTSLLFLYSNSLLAQSTNGKISGLVLDQTRGVISGADLLVVNDVTRVKTSTATNAEGIYVFPNLTPGPYRLQVSKPGFKTLIKPDIVLNVQGALSINFTLPVGAVSDSVTVQGGAAIVNTVDGTVATVVDRQFIENIPLNGRSFQSLIDLTPGVVVVPGGSNGFGQFSVNGQRASANNFTVDGLSANFGANPGTFGAPANSGNTPGLTAFGTTQSLASVDDLQEFKVQTSTYSSEYGRQPGGQVSIVTRSGTNQFHGTLFDYLRNDALDANDWFADRAGQAKPPEKQNDFGGTIGGPVSIPPVYGGRDRTFFFFSYEGLRLRLPEFTLTNVPTEALRQQASSGIQPILNAFPLPNGKALGNGFAELGSGYSNGSRLDASSIRIDHSFNGKVAAFGRYSKSPSESTTRSPGNLANVTTNRLNTQTFTGVMTAQVSRRISNDIRANYTYNGALSTTVLDDFGGAVAPMRSALIPTQYDSSHAATTVQFLLPGMTAPAGESFLFLSNPVSTQREFNIVDNFSYTVGAHQLKFGIDYRRLTPIAIFNPYFVSTLFSSEQQILAATTNTGSDGASIAMGPIFLNFSAYAQDTWRFTRRLTLDLGLRWDVNPAPSEESGELPIAVNEVTNLASVQLAPLGTKEYRTTYKNFAPRFGVAYQLSQAPGLETIIHGGFGVFYDTGNDIAALNFNQRYPYSATRTQPISYPLVASQVAPPALAIQTGLTPPYPSFLALFDPDLQLPYTLQWSAGIEQSISKDQALKLSYVGAAARRLGQSSEINLKAINPNFTTVFLSRSTATSDYHAFQAQFQRRLSRGIQALVSYSWSHALDDDSGGNTFRVAQRGNADFDVRHVFAAAATCAVPGPHENAILRAIFDQWFIDTSFHAQSALPVDIVAQQVFNPADGSLVNVRPNVIPGVPFYVEDPAAPGGRKINSAAFQIPGIQSGNLGRNQVRGLGAWQQDFALRREVPLHESIRLELRLEGFNIYNHPSFGAIQTKLTAPNFGQATNMLNRQLGGISQLYQIGGPRSLQVAMKVIF
jgi:hypothetical protein